MSSFTLDQAEVGHWYRVSVQPLPNHRLMSLGFLPMENVCVRKKSKRASGVYIVQVDNALFGLRSEEAKQVLVDQL